ncbi:MAG: hypothetical protein IKE55_09740 [Kiritimatiellae bacterium]|nr:hypothetical protein [Kiritimatiellia bacterium]
MDSRSSMFVALAAFMFAHAGYCSINVKDFGAVGDGVHDDTLALQKAADAVYPDGKYISGRDFLPLRKRFISSSPGGPAREVFFPKGIYRITGPVVFTHPQTLRGEDGAVIRNEADGQDTFYMQYTKYTRVENLVFEGGRTQLRIWTIDGTGPMVVQKCTFRRAAQLGFSYRTYAWKDKPVHGEMDHNESDCSPCIVTRRSDGRCDVTPRDPSLMKNNYSSALLLIERCRFEDNAKAFSIISDGQIVRDCTVNAPRWAAGPAVEVKGKTLFQRTKFDVARNPDLEQYAIMTHHLITTIQDCEVTSDGDLTAVLAAGRGCISTIGTRLAIRNLRVDTGLAPLVRIPKLTFPNMLSVRGVEAVKRLPKPKPLLKFEKEPLEGDVPVWRELAKKEAVYVMPEMAPERCYSVAVSGVDPAVFDLRVPKLVERFLWKPPADAYEPDTECFGQIEPSEWGKVYADASMGADTGEMLLAADDYKLHKLFARAMDEAAGAPCTVCLPPRWLTVKTPIRLRGKVRVTVDGIAVLTGRTDEEPMFTVEEGADVVFENILFRGGRHVLQADVPAGRARFFFCGFFDQAESSVHSVAKGKSAMRIEMSGCNGHSHDFYRGNANPMLFDGTEFNPGVNHRRGEEKPSYCPMTNLAGGRLEYHSVLSSPMLFEFVWPFSKIYEKPTPEQMGDFRWVDNYGTFRAYDMRFGGEWDGLTAVYQYGKDATTYIEGGLSVQLCQRCLAGRAIVYTDTPESQVRLAEVSGFDFPSECPFRRRLPDGRELPLKTFLCNPNVPQR